MQLFCRSGCKARIGSGTREAAKKSPRLVAVQYPEVSMETARGVESPQVCSSEGGAPHSGNANAGT